MGKVTVIILHPAPDGDGPLTSLLEEARQRLGRHHVALFSEAGAGRVSIERGSSASSFAQRLDELVSSVRGGLVLLGAGAVPMLRALDAGRLVDAAGGRDPVAMTNNRYSSDVIAVGDAGLLRGLGGERGDNALPRRLAERGLRVAELPGRGRLALDLDSPLDLALLALVPGVLRTLRELASAAGVVVPRLAELRAVSADPHSELLVFGRSSSRTLAWLERRTACRIRFLSEERGLRTAPLLQRPPHSTLGRLLHDRGPEALASIIGELGDGAILDSRVLFADYFGRDEGGWPSAEDRFASDLLRPEGIADPWLKALTADAAASRIPIMLGGHTTVGPGLRFLLGRRVPSSP